MLRPPAHSDAMVLLRLVKRLLEIETDNDVVVEINHAKELAELLPLQKLATR